METIMDKMQILLRFNDDCLRLAHDLLSVFYNDCLIKVISNVAETFWSMEIGELPLTRNHAFSPLVVQVRRVGLTLNLMPLSCIFNYLQCYFRSMRGLRIRRKLSSESRIRTIGSIS
ncbi:uncharacterized protein A4U43_C08F4280 [Asparagus officinalis]|nr:uncharacterized protein A4U43_C08F4280 [Asparagus officinalis]